MDKQDVAISKRIDAMWNRIVDEADAFVSKKELSKLSECEVEAPSDVVLSTFPMELFRLKRLAYNVHEGIVDKLVNVYSSLNSIGASVFIIINGKADGSTNFYIGSLDRNDAEASKMMLKRSFAGNFPGIELEYQNKDDKDRILDECFPTEYKKMTVSSVSVSADFRKTKTESDTTYIQGLEKFIDTMRGKEYSTLFLADPVSRDDCVGRKNAYEDIITELSKLSKLTVNYSENNSEAVNESLSNSTSQNVSSSISNSVSNTTAYSVGKSKGRSHGHSYGFFGMGFNGGGNSGFNTTNTDSNTDASGTTETTGSGTASSKTVGNTSTHGASASLTVNVENKRINNLIAKLEYELKKLEIADSFGLWDCAIYTVSSDSTAPIIAANSIRSLAIGDESKNAESFINCWSNSSYKFTDGTVENLMKFIHYGMHPVFKKSVGENHDMDYYYTPAVAVGGNVLPSIFGLPMRSVPGITIIECPEFGRNIVTDDWSNPGNRRIHLGNIVYMGKDDGTPIDLFVNSLSMHTFVCGAPGSGKSNTVYKIIYELCRLNIKPERDEGYGNVRFLVIEPAKGEYKYEFGKLPKVNLFTTQTGVCRMLRIDPFEFPYEKMDVREHIERLKNILMACWPLTAAMPAILSSAIERSFIQCGWDIESSVYVFPGKVKFPTFASLMKSLKAIIESSEYSAQSKGDYKGALLTRVESLTKGIPGAVFNNAGVVSDNVLFDENTIIDLSTVGSTEARSLIMGILVMKMENYRKATADRANYPLRHVTILEEAHNLLPRCSTQQSDDSSNVQGKSVEFISTAISEMRTYGEGFIIVDQSPSAVADTAISNTSTKIIMRLPGSTDVQAAGSSIGLSEEQCGQIPMLAQGQALVKQGNWIAPVMATIDKAPQTHATRRIPTYDHENLKLFRADFIEKIYTVASRNKNRKVFPSADRQSVVNYLERQKDIAPDLIDKYKAYWDEFCDLDNKQRHLQINRLIVKILSFELALTMIMPRPKDKGAPTRDELEGWLWDLKTVLDAYVNAEDDLMRDILCSVMKYCVYYSESKTLQKCSEAAFKMFVIKT